MSVSITTDNLTKPKMVQINGMAWEFTSPGAGIMLELTRLGRKIKSEAATEDEQADMLEKLYEYYQSVFKDSTEDNSEVKAWLYRTSYESIGLTIKKCQEA
jgi:hypothetical protein